MTAASPVKKRRPASSTVPERYDAFLSGEINIEDLDMEELLKGQIRDKNGSFGGRPPKLIPRAFHVKVTQELLHRAESTWRENMNDAMQVFVEIMNNPRVRAQDRLYAAQYIFERIAGKIPEQQFVTATVKRWEDVAEATIVEVYDEAVSQGAEDVYVITDAEPGSDEVARVLPKQRTSAPAPPRSPRRPTRSKKVRKEEE